MNKEIDNSRDKIIDDNYEESREAPFFSIITASSNVTLPNTEEALPSKEANEVLFYPSLNEPLRVCPRETRELLWNDLLPIEKKVLHYYLGGLSEGEIAFKLRLGTATISRYMLTTKLKYNIANSNNRHNLTAVIIYILVYNMAADIKLLSKCRWWSQKNLGIESEVYKRLCERYYILIRRNREKKKQAEMRAAISPDINIDKIIQPNLQ